MPSSTRRALRSVRVPRAFCRPLILAAMLLVSALSAPARADMISDWTARAEAIALAAKHSPLSRTQHLAILHVAMFEAMNVVEGRATPNGSICPPMATSRSTPRRPPPPRRCSPPSLSGPGGRSQHGAAASVHNLRLS